MKILINAGYYNRVPYADNNIEIDLAKQIIAMGVKCDIIAMTYDIEERIQNIDGVKVIKIPYYCKLIMDARIASKIFFGNITNGISLKKKLIFFIQHPIFSFVMQMNKIKRLKKHFLSNYVKEVKEVIKQENYDVLIGAVFSFEQTEKLFLSNEINIKKIYYQLDPHGLNAIYRYKIDEVISEEVETMKKSSIIITTEELYKQYIQCEEYKCVIDKMYTLKFPTYKKEVRNISGRSPIDFNDNKINILFSGTVYDKIRNPKKCLEILDNSLRNVKNVKIYFLGHFNSMETLKFIKNSSLNIEIIPPVSNEESILAMKNADILLNIGNNVENMVPSKIFTYFALEKPILHFEKIINCAAKKYLIKYPKQLTVKEYAESFDYEKIRDFVINSKSDNQIENIDEIFYSSTPEYVAKQMLDIINLKGENVNVI